MIAWMDGETIFVVSALVLVVGPFLLYMALCAIAAPEIYAYKEENPRATNMEANGVGIGRFLGRHLRR
jgi:hypothetical protein